ncbi:MAG: hypothetical protein D6718_04865 [Acidobacteria bacterium]|nr:MAG: hypothetical protein D6718_04865 [Acidobacteriota bacterium]
MRGMLSRQPEKAVRRLLLRAVVLFALLLASDVILVAWLFFHDFDQRAVRSKMIEAIEAARAMAGEISAELAPGGAIDHLRVIEKRAVLGRVIDRYTARLRVVDFVEVLTPDGRLLFRKSRRREAVANTGQAFGGAAPPSPDAPPAPAIPRVPGRTFALRGVTRDQVVEVPLAAQTGAVRVGLDPNALQAEFERQRRSLVLQLLFGGAVSLLLLAVAFLYVLRMVHRVRRLEAEAQRADQLAALGTLASGLAHEIRNPLNAMNINLQLLEEGLAEGVVDDESLSLLRSSRAEVQRLERLVKDFLAFARPASLQREEMEVEEIVRDVVAFLRPQFASCGVELDFEQEEGTPPVRIDSGQIRQALVNILQNALEVSSKGKRVLVRTGPTERGEARIEVIDEGPGIPPEKRERIFEIFYSEKPAGSGLGLPIARRAVDAHGGRIELESAPGGGSLFRIVLPPAVAGEPGEVDAGAVPAWRETS